MTPNMPYLKIEVPEYNLLLSGRVSDNNFSLTGMDIMMYVYCVQLPDKEPMCNQNILIIHLPWEISSGYLLVYLLYKHC